MVLGTALSTLGVQYNNILGAVGVFIWKQIRGWQGVEGEDAGYDIC